MRGLRALTSGAPPVEHIGRDFEWRIAPAELLAGALDLVGAQRRAVALLGASLVRRAEADGGTARDHGGAIGPFCMRDCRRNRLRIMPIDTARVPARRLEALHLIDRVR